MASCISINGRALVPHARGSWVWWFAGAVLALGGTFSGQPVAAQQRTLGLDVSAWQGNLSQATWNNFRHVHDRQFVFIRSSRGGTTGFYNQSDPANELNQNTLSQRYDDPYFVQNITRATAAGMYAGAYHFSRPDIVESTKNSGGIANTGTDEADHFLQMAGAWMRPGYLLPVHDLEAGDQIRSDNELAQFTLDFTNRIYEVMGIRPAIYVNGNYAHYVLGGASPALRDEIYATHPTLWMARWPNQSNPDAIPVQTGHPSDSISWTYGLWDDHGVTHPWTFWQYASTGRLSSFNNGNSNLDFNVAQGGIEFVKDQLVPAVWMHDSDGQWTTLENWNSGQTPVPPVQGPGQASRVGPLTLPGIRLPGADDTVVLDRPGAEITVTLASGTHNVRKLIVHEALDITGGKLTVNYTPSPDSTPYAARFAAPVSLTGGGELSVHTLYVAPGQTFTLGGKLELHNVQLEASSSLPAGIALVDDVTFAPLDGATATISGQPAFRAVPRIDLHGEQRAWTVLDGAADVDLRVDVPIVGGTLEKRGSGTLELTAATDYQGDVVVDQGRLLLSDALVDDAADVHLSSAAELMLDFTGTDVVNALYLDGVSLAAGTWGAPGSAADFHLSQLSGAGLLDVTTYVPLLPGDFNDDGVVDAADYIRWRDNLGGPAESLANHANGGPVGLAHYQTWKANFGSSLPATAISAAPVPEPTSGVIALAATLLAWRGWSSAGGRLHSLQAGR